MKMRKLSLAMIFLAITIVAYIGATFLFCYTTKPEITTGEFPFSITYEYKGETGTLSGVYRCAFSSSCTIQGEHHRYWEGEATYNNPKYPEYPHFIDHSEELLTTLAIQENMYPGYFMGDPLHQDYYHTYGQGFPEPHVEYYDYRNDIYLDEENKDEILESIDFKILDFTYPEPIENRFTFSGIRYEADNVFLFVAIMVVFLLLCLIFVRRDRSRPYTRLDKAGIVFNFLLGIFAVPFITVVCMLFGVVETDIEIIDQTIYNIPSPAIACLALSVVFRRKGFPKTGFFIQFAGFLPFVLLMLLEVIFRFH